MNFEQTSVLVKAINEIETWTASITREWAGDKVDFDRLTQLQGYLDEAKQTVFELCTK